MNKPILQYRDETYREIETTLDISGTSLHIVKKIGRGNMSMSSWHVITLELTHLKPKVWVFQDEPNTTKVRSSKKHFRANGRLFFRKNRTC